MKKPRKPRGIFCAYIFKPWFKDAIAIDVFPDNAKIINAKQARKLAAWLIRAAEYLESKGGK